MKKKAVSKAAQERARIHECGTKLGTMVNDLEREYQPAIVTAALNRQVNSRREAQRITRERAMLRKRESELKARAARL